MANGTPQAIGRQGYALNGTLLEICSCATSCPCFIGENPDGGECFGVIAFHLDQGWIADQDVSGLTVVNVAHIPGNALAGNWRVVLLIDDRATPAQEQALLQALLPGLLLGTDGGDVRGGYRQPGLDDSAGPVDVLRESRPRRRSHCQARGAVLITLGLVFALASGGTGGPGHSH